MSILTNRQIVKDLYLNKSRFIVLSKKRINASSCTICTLTIVYLMCKKEETKKITENRTQSHPVGIWPPPQPSWSHVWRQNRLPSLQINLKASGTSTQQSVSSLHVLRNAKTFQRKAKHHQNIFTMLMLHQHHLYLINLVQVQCRNCFKGRKKGNTAINLPVPFSIWI